MSSDKSVTTAIARLGKALDGLESAVNVRLESEKSVGDVEAEVQRMQIDRSELAKNLDQTTARATELETTNRDVSRRLIAAMETIQSVIDGDQKTK